MRWREQAGVRWLEAELPGARAAFSTRLGGVSAAPYDHLNLGALTDDERDSVVENRRRLASALGFDSERVVIGRQVHAAELASHRGPQAPSPFAAPGAEIPSVDGHFTEEGELPLLVFVADCLPVALAGSGGVAMLHCGWRGLAAGIIARGVRSVAATAAAIGPGIGACCYRVGQEVTDALSAPVGEPRGFGTHSLDLASVARERLVEAGVAQIETAPLCTSCEGGLFFSHRRDAGRTGRQAGVVWRTGNGDDEWRA